MTLAKQVIERIEAAGGVLAVRGQRIFCRLPEDAADLLDELRARKDDVLILLRERGEPPPMPPGVRLVCWEPKDPPVILVHLGVVTDVSLFVRRTLSQLDSALHGKEWLAGHWTVRELVDRLEQCGVVVRVETISQTSGSANANS